jgi:hypothetical protein
MTEREFRHMIRVLNQTNASTERYVQLVCEYLGIDDTHMKPYSLIEQTLHRCGVYGIGYHEIASVMDRG